MKRPTSNMPKAGADDGATLALLDAQMRIDRTRNRFMCRGHLRRAREHFAAANAALKGDDK